MQALQGKVAVVTGASRGVGKGIAIGLGEAGATVYLSGRTTQEGQGRLPGSIFCTAQAVEAAGGRGMPVACDHTCDEDVERLFSQVLAEQGRIDVLVNNIWGGYERIVDQGEYTWERPFWEQPLWRWEAMFAAGVRAHFTAARLAAPAMIDQRDGLIANISYYAGQKYLANVIYGVAKVATDRLAQDMAHELRPYQVAAVSLYPGLVRTEGVMEVSHLYDLNNSESPQFSGRVIAALAADPAKMEKSGKVLVVAALAQEYGITDIDGKRPRPLTLEEA